MPVSIDVLGPLRAGDTTPIELTRPSHRRMLSILALEGGKRISTDRLIDRFWGEEPPPAAKAALQTHVSALRRLLGDDLIVTEGHGYRLDLHPEQLDANSYMALADIARSAASKESWSETLAAIDRATDLWRGQPYWELLDDEFARPSITKLEETRLDLLDLRAEALLSMGRHRDAIAELESLVVEYPLRERFWEHLMTARLRSGRPTEALRAFQDVKDELAEAGLEPGERLRNLEERILIYGEAPPEGRSNLPTPISRFVGRASETKVVHQTILDNRLTTIVGAGGAGKTRIAIETTARLLHLFPDGIWLVELGAVEEGSAIVSELTRSLGLQPGTDDPIEHVEDYLQDKKTLLLIDNVEHLVDIVAPLLRRILQAAPDVRVLTTSREPMHVTGEALVHLQGMAVPSLPISPGDALEYDAIKLFEERARLVRHQFEISNSNLAEVIEICRQLDGMPLAIELAAARVRSLEPSVIASRLDDRFAFLTGAVHNENPKHETLEATIEWSYQLLTSSEKALLENLSVFRGGFDHPMAEAIGTTSRAASGEILGRLIDLVDKSLIATYESPSGRRFRFLESVRVFAQNRLQASDRLAEVEKGMVGWALEFSEQVRDDRVGPRSNEMGTRLLDESENLFHAGDIARRTGQSDASMSISAALASYWQIAGYPSRAAEILRQGLAEPAVAGDMAIYLHTSLADTVKFTSDDDSLENAKHAFELCVDQPPSPVTSTAASNLALLYLHKVDEDSTKSIGLARRGVELAVECSDPYAELWSRRVLAKALAWSGRHDDAHKELDECARIGRTSVGNATYEGFGYSHQVLYSDPERRRYEPISAMKDIETRFSETLLNWDAIRNHGIDEAMIWGTWVHCQAGEFDAAAAASARYSAIYREGFSATGQVIASALIAWMRGDLEEAWTILSSIHHSDVSSRWYHDYFPLVADIATDLGDLNSARQAAMRWMAEPAHSSEQSMKLGVLNPLVRAEIDAAKRNGDERSSAHGRAASDHVDEMKRILEESPPLNGGSFSMETPRTHLAFAEAELSRLDGENPELWKTAMDRADYLYFRLYAQIRFAEALWATGSHDRSAIELKSALERSREIGAKRLVDLVEEVADGLEPG